MICIPFGMQLFPHHDEPSLDDINDHCAYAGPHQGTTSSAKDDGHSPPCMNLLRLLPNSADPGNSPTIAWLSTDTTKHIFAVTTQHACTPCTPMSTILNMHLKSPNPAMNVHHCDEAVAPDIEHSSTSAIDNRVTVAHLFNGCDSLVCRIYGNSSGKQLVTTLEENIHIQGAPTKSDSDCTPVEISEKLQDIPLIHAMNDLAPHLGLLHSNPALYMVVWSHLQGVDSFQSISFPQLAILLPVYGEIKATASMPKGYTSILTNPKIN